MENKRTLQELEHIYKNLVVSEKGYAVSAVNVKNRGLKVLLKSFAQQRTRFKAEAMAEMRRLGGKPKTWSGLLSTVHRGRINIFAALTIGKDEREQAVLKEILIGERFIIQSYKQTLKKGLTPEARQLIARQLEDIKKVVDQVTLLYGREGRRLVVRLFESEKDADTAELEMKNAGLRPDVVVRVKMKDIVDLYESNNTIISETVISGAVGGAFWVGLIGLVAGVGMQYAGAGSFGIIASLGNWAYLTLAGIFSGVFIGSLLGFAIGMGISREDAYHYELSIKRGKILLLAKVDSMRAPEAGQIMSLVNLRARDQIEKATA